MSNKVNRNNPIINYYYDKAVLQEIKQPVWPRVRMIRDGDAIEVSKVVPHPEKEGMLLIYVNGPGRMPFEVTPDFVEYWNPQPGDFVIRLDEVHMGEDDFIGSFMFVLPKAEFHQTFNRIS